MNHSGPDLARRPHRHEVHSHIQAVFHHWRRKEDVRKLKASVRVGELPLRTRWSGSAAGRGGRAGEEGAARGGGGGGGGGEGGGAVGNNTSRIWTGREVQRSAAPHKACYTRRPTRRDTDASAAARRAKATTHLAALDRRPPFHRHHRPPPSPTTALGQGCSDPFSVLTVPLTPLTTHIYRYAATTILPLRFPPEPRSRSPHRLIRTLQAHAVAALQEDAANAYGWLSVFASTFAVLVARGTVAENFGRAAMDFRGRASEVLRRRLSLASASVEGVAAGGRGGEGRPLAALRDERTLRAMVTLYSADLASRDVAAAMVHARMVGNMFEATPDGIDGVDLFTLENALLVDEMRAIVFMAYSAFSFPSWRLEPLVEVLAVPLGLSPALKARFNEQLFAAFPADMVLADTALARDLRDLKEVVLLDHYIDTFAPETLVDDIVFRHLQVRRHIAQARLSNYYLQITAGTELLGDVFSQLKAATAMAALYWSRIFHRDLSSTRTTRFPLNDLRAAIERCRMQDVEGLVETCHRDVQLDISEPRAIDTMSSAMSELWLWILYVGAQAEQTASQSAMGDIVGLPLTGRFVAHAKKLGMMSWKDLRTTLQNYLYSDRMKPNGSEWWWKALAVGV